MTNTATTHHSLSTSTSGRTFRKVAAALVTGAIASGVCFAANTTSAAAGKPPATAGPRVDANAGSGLGQDPGTSKATSSTSTSSSSTSNTGSKSETVARTMGNSSSEGVSQVQMIHRPDQALAGADTGVWASWADFMTFAVEDAASVWNWYYQQWGYGESKVNYYWSAPGEVVYSACDGDPLTDDSSPFYCGKDDTIYFSQVRAQWYWENSGGDFGVVTSIAHEYGHNVQNELGISRAKYTGASFEMQADCYAGAFTHAAYYQGILDANDVQEGMNSRYMVGDNNVDDPGHHGTPQERVDAFWLGYNADGPAGCDSVLVAA